MNYFICSIISFFTGIAVTLFFQNFVEIRIKKPDKHTFKKNIENTNPKINCINQMLWEINKKGNLPINLSAPVLMSLKEIFKTNNWEEKIDNETIENLYRIYERWQRHINNKPQKAIKVSGAGGFHKYEYWEGTMEEYKEALAKNLIDKFTDVNIVEYTGEILAMDEEGQIEEYME